MAVGEACGEAAVLCLENGVEPRDVSVQELRNRLRANGNLF